MEQGDENYSKNQFDYYCPVCDYGYHNGQELIDHLMKEHGFMKEDSIKIKNVDDELFENIQSIIEHSRGKK